MQRTQPKKTRVIDGGKGGKGLMVTVEESEVVKERRRAAFTAAAGQEIENASDDANTFTETR